MKRKLIVTYDPNSKSAVPDGLVDDVYRGILEQLRVAVPASVIRSKILPAFSTENIFNRLRLGMALGEFDAELIFRYRNIYISVNRYGAIVDWPNGFCDLNADLSDEILRAAMARKRAEWEAL